MREVLTAHFAPATEGDTHSFFSALTKGLADCRAATHRDLRTGERLPNAEHDSWVGALGYLALLDQIGNCFAPAGQKRRSRQRESPIVAALQDFSNLSAEEIDAVYALRCAFAHDFSLFNVHPSRPTLTHCFYLFSETQGPMVRLPKVRWQGDYAVRPDECRTHFGLTLLGDFVEEICGRLVLLAKDQQLAIKLIGGAEELCNRYGVMKVLPTLSRPT